MHSPLRLLKEIAVASNEASSSDEAFQVALDEIRTYANWPVAHVYLHRPEESKLIPTNLWSFDDPNRFEDFRRVTGMTEFASGEGLPGRILKARRAVWIEDVLADDNFPRARLAKDIGVRGAFGFPVLVGDEIVAVMEFFSDHPAHPDADFLDLMGQIGVQLGRVVERERAAANLSATRRELEENVARRTAELTALNENLKRELERREHIESALRDSEAMYHSLVEHAPLSIYRKNLDGRVVFGNASYGKDLGIETSELIGRTDFDLFSEEQARKYVADDARVIETGEPLHKVERHEGAKGTIFVEVLKAPVYDHKGRCVGTQGMFWDVTEEHEARRKLEESAAELKRSNEDLAQFAYVASHDLQEPLRMVASYLQLLERRYEGILDQSGREFIRFAVDGAERMKNLIRALLEYSRIGTKGAPHERVPLDAVLAETLGVLQLAISEVDATVTCDSLPDIRCDRIQISQLFQNLIGNALKFCRDRPPVVHVSARRSDDCRGWTFSVRDNGIGIDTAHLARIFVIFQRLHSREDYAGTGIGLALCKRIVEHHHGKIWVESEPGIGTTVFFTLPA